MRIPIVNEVKWGFGRVAERLMAAVLKTANGESRSWVQIPPLPPVILWGRISSCWPVFNRPLRTGKRASGSADEIGAQLTTLPHKTAQPQPSAGYSRL
jgi:hypothetical protein